jgi:hypothetical protein
MILSFRNQKWGSALTAVSRRSACHGRAGQLAGRFERYSSAHSQPPAFRIGTPTLRAMIVHRYMEMGLTPAQLKAVSQSLGHSDVLTTLTNDGQLSIHR